MNNIRKQIIDIIKSFLKDEYNVSIKCDINSLYELSNRLSITNIIGYTLNKSNIKNTIFENSIYKVVAKYERFKSTREELDKLLNNKVKYLYIKGLSIAKYYNEPYLRNSSDVDIIVEHNDFDLAYKILTTNGYKTIRRDSQEITMVNSNGVVLDFHYSYMLENELFEEVYKNLFNDSHELDINYNYVYCVEHCRKHFKSGILTYKIFIDLFYLRKHINNKIVDELLNKLNLIKFNNSLNSYLDCILENKQYSEIDSKIEDFIFEYAIDSGNKNRVLMNSYGRSKFAYLLSRIFIPYKLISGEYPILKKYKILLPVYYVKRVVRIARGKRGAYAIMELKNNSDSNRQDIDKMHSFICKIGLND